MKHSSLLMIYFFHFNLLIIWWKIDTVNAIVGGEYAELGQYRYMVSIRDSNRQHVCGGAIIHEEYIITAAHCFINRQNNFKNEKFTVLADTNNLKIQNPARIVFEVSKVFVPKQYNKINPNPRNIEYREIADIALVEVRGLIQFGASHFDKLRLPERKDGHFPKYLNERPIILGYGMELPWNQMGKRDHGFSDNKLKYIKTVVLQKATCKNLWPNTKIYDSHVCAQAVQNYKRPSGVCDGDSGSPLVLNGIVIGVLGVTRPDCNEKYYSALYTRVTSFMTFVMNVMNNIKSDDIRVADYKDKSVIETVSTLADLMGSDNISNTK